MGIDLRTKKQRAEDRTEVKPSSGKGLSNVVLKGVKKDGQQWLEVDAKWLGEQTVKELISFAAAPLVLKLEIEGKLIYITNNESSYNELIKRKDVIVLWMHEIIATLAAAKKSCWMDTLKMVVQVKDEFPNAVVQETLLQ